MREAGLPLVPGLAGPARDAEEAAPIAAARRLPGAAQGGGRRRRARHAPRRREPEDLGEPVPSRVAGGAGRASATAACTSRSAVERRATSRSRCSCDAYGDVAASAASASARSSAATRSCSRRRRRPLLDDAHARRRWPRRRERACRAICYLNAGTIEFLVDADGSVLLHGDEHAAAGRAPRDRGRHRHRPRARADAGRGGRAPVAHRPRRDARGHAIECRVNAEDPVEGLPAERRPGDAVRSAARPRVRVDTHAFSGYRMPPTYDSLLAKVIVHAEDREPASSARIARARRAGRRGREDDARPAPRRAAARRGSAAGLYTTAYIEEAAADLPHLGSRVTEHPYRRVEGEPRVRDHAGRARRGRRARPRRWSTASRSRASGSPARAAAVRTSRSSRRGGARADRDRLPVRRRAAGRAPRCRAGSSATLARAHRSRGGRRRRRGRRGDAVSASRRQARRVALVLLYQRDVTGHDLAELYAAYETDARSPVPSYAQELVEAVLSDPGRLDLLIAEHATGWTVDRIAAIERAALRIAVLELAEKPDIPRVGRDRRGGAAHQAVRVAGGGRLRERRSRRRSASARRGTVACSRGGARSTT